MDYKKVIAKIKRDYPGKKIIRLPEDEATEILVEIEATEEHPEYSVAVAIIDRSIPHYHNQVEELYEVMQGELSVFVNGVENKLVEGDEFVIKPGSTHYAVGDETWVRCTARPGWTVGDHLMEDTQEKRNE